MTSSDTTQTAQQVLNEILERLDEDRIRRAIDEPIEAAVRRFRYRWAPPSSARAFHEVTGDLVRRLYQRGRRLPRRLSPDEARAEAMSLLEQGYRRLSSRGYDGALADAVHQRLDGMNAVLLCLVEIIKSVERRAYVEWVFAGRLGRCDWPTRVEIVRLLTGRLAPCLPPELQACAPGQLVDLIPLLIQDDMATDRLLGQVLKSPTARPIR